MSPERGTEAGPAGGRVRLRRLPHGEGLPLPSRATEGAAGYDVRSAEASFELGPGEARAVATGFQLELPAGWECQVRPRSGLALRSGIIVPNAPGTIDPDYRGEVKVILRNLSGEPFRVERGERIAQLVFARFEAPELAESDELGETARGAGGFGSTGRG